MKKYISTREAAEYCNVSTVTIQILCRNKTLRHKKKGLMYMVCVEDLDKYLTKIQKSCEIENDIDNFIKERDSLNRRLKEEVSIKRERLYNLRAYPRIIGLMKNLLYQEIERYKDSIDPDAYKTLVGIVRFGTDQDITFDKFRRAAIQIRRINSEIYNLKQEVAAKDNVIKDLSIKIHKLENPEDEDPGVSEERRVIEQIVEVLSKSIFELKLSTRAINVLSSRRISTIADLVSYRKPELFKFRGMGKKTFDELEDLIENRLNLEFGINTSKFFDEYKNGRR